MSKVIEDKDIGPNDIYDERAEELLPCLSICAPPDGHWPACPWERRPGVAATLRKQGKEIKLHEKEIDRLTKKVEYWTKRYWTLADKFDAQEIVVIKQEERTKELEEALTNIAEYWNGHENERALIDACKHNVRIARAALEQSGVQAMLPK